MKQYLNKKFIKYCIYGVILFLLYIIQISPYRLVDILNVTPELVLPALILIAMYDGEKVGALSALVVGLVYDSSSKVTGFNTILFIVFTFFTGVLIATQLKRNIISAIVLCSSAVLLQNLLTYFFFFGIAGSGNFILALKTIILPKLIYTLFISAILYYVFLIIKMQMFDEDADEQYSLSSHVND